MAPRVLVAIPPLQVGTRFIDNPAFCFLVPLMFASAASQRYQVRVDNAPLEYGALLRTPQGWLLGGEPASFWDRLVQAPEELVVLAWTSFHRRAGNPDLQLPGPEHPCWRRARAGNQHIHVVDLWHGECRFEPVRSSANPDLPLQGLWLEQGEETLAAALDLHVSSLQVPMRDDWLTRKGMQQLAVLSPIIRTGAAPAAALEPDGASSDTPVRCWPMLSSAGCSYRCLFCFKPGLASQHRVRPMPAIIRELDRLVEVGCEQVFLLDPIANFDRAHFDRLLHELRVRRLRAVFPNGLALKHLAPEQLPLLREVCSTLVVSIESGSPRTLQRLRKPVQLEHAEAIVREASRLGFDLSAHYIVGVPGEGADDVAQTLELATRLYDEYRLRPSIQRYVSAGDDSTLFTNEGQHNDPCSASEVVTLAAAGQWVQSQAAAEQTPKIIVNVTYACNNRCVFCAVGDRKRVHGLLGEQTRLVREAFERGVRHLDIDGGEPTLYPGIWELLDLASALGYERITLTTNGRRLCYPDFAQRLRHYERLELCISLHGHEASLHDAITRAPGSFHQTLTGIWNASRAGLAVGLNVTVVAQNAEHLTDIAAVGVAQGAQRVAVQRYTPFGHCASGLEVPPERVLAQIDTMRAKLGNVPVALVNFPACEAGPHLEHAVSDRGKSVRTMQFVDARQVTLSKWLAHRRAHEPRCEPCYLKRVCAGKWTAGEQAEPDDELIDLVVGFSCKLGCRFCASPPTSGSDMDGPAVTTMLRRLAPRGRHLRVSGGEPTDRPDLRAIVESASAEGYGPITVQTHGLRLADLRYARELRQAGVDGVHLSLFGGTDEQYGASVGVSDGFSRFCMALEHAQQVFDGRVALDVLALRPFLAHLPKTLSALAGRGVREMMVWLPAYEGRAAGASELIPTIREAAPAFVEALQLEDRVQGLQVRSLYMPLCALGPYAHRSFNVRTAKVVIATSQFVLPMHQCVIDAGVHWQQCRQCVMKPDCFGLRASYVARHGDGEVQALH